MTKPALSLTEFHHPLTFKARGVAVPFTTPLLAGTRVRASKRDDVELVVPSPSGGRGVYVLNWPGVRALCTPSVHDTLLFQHFAGLKTIDPAGIRDAALDVARQGRAGRDAAMAAEAAIARDRSRRPLVQFRITMALLEHAEGPNAAAQGDPTSDVERRAAAILHRLAPVLGRPAADLANGLAVISNMFVAIGADVTDRDARIPWLLARLQEAQADLGRWVDADPENDVGGLGQAIAAAMKRAHDSGTAVLAKTRHALLDIPAVLRRWIKDPEGVAVRISRCEWLLDGWERVILLWFGAQNSASRRAALLEMAPLVPVLPHEVTEWIETPIPTEAMQQAWRVTSHEDTWRTGGSAFALMERNERLLAIGAGTRLTPAHLGQGPHGS